MFLQGIEDGGLEPAKTENCLEWNCVFVEED